MNELFFFEQFYIKLYNIYAFVSQILFFVMCSLAFNEYEGEDEKYEEYILIALKTLLFYSVFTYFATKSRDILSSDQYRASVQNWSFMEGVCRIVIEWAKAIIVVICLREQGIYFKPSPHYAAITFTFYLCTEKIFLEFFHAVFHYFEFDAFEHLEHLYVPLRNKHLKISELLIKKNLMNMTIFVLFA
ncbi:uncharacterized protein BDFB_002241 [Asbolus verrucosus]|uniref:Uncharacterized protein n=1 Tax=Asbolus verrucosus TaxID=1661398 RepID=A0A482VRZ1_ASBVE|nr:uncharacterized protein BDFB_002241 [Asbolus verrucosus]